MLTRLICLILAIMHFLLAMPAHSRLSIATWERFDRTTVLLVRGYVLAIEDNSPKFSTATIEVDEVILNESDVREIRSTIDVKFSPNDFQPINIGSNFLRSNTHEAAYFFLGRYEGFWRFSDPEAAIWEIVETQSENQKKRVLCFPSSLIKKLPNALFERLEISVVHMRARDCQPNRLRMYTKSKNSFYYPEHYITEDRLLRHYNHSNTMHLRQ